MPQQNQESVRKMVGKAVTTSLALPDDKRYPKNAPKVNAIMEDAFMKAYYSPDKRLDD